MSNDEPTIPQCPSLVRPLWLTVAVLMAVGVLMVCSAGMAIAQGDLDLLKHEWFRHMLLVPAGLLAVLLASFLPYRVWRGWAKYLLIGVAICLLVLVQHPAIGPEVNHSQRWIRFGPNRAISFQPSEIGKYALIVAVAGVLAVSGVGRKLSWKRFLVAFGLVLVVLGLTGKEDFGTAALMGMVVLTLLAVGGARWHQLVAFGGTAAGGFAALLLAEPYRIERLKTFLDPWSVRKEEGFQLVQSLMSIGSGGLWGKGLGNGWQKHGFLPEVTSDFIFAHICEELGLLGAAVVVALFILLGYLGWRVVRHCRDPFGKLVALGITVTICLQAAIHIAVVTASVPTKGIGLPLISAGGTGVIITGAAIGLLLNIARATERLARLPAVLPSEARRGESELVLVSLPPRSASEGDLQFEGT